MPSKKSARKATDSSADQDLPNWRRKLVSVPEAERCRSQKDLVRSLELIDMQLEMFKPSTMPSPSISEEDRLKVTLAAFEVDFLRFNLNNCIPIYPANRYPDILPWLQDTQMNYWMYLRMLEENPAMASKRLTAGPGLQKILSSAVKILFMHFHACSAMNSSHPYNFSDFARFWTVWQRRWDELEVAGANEMIAGLGSRLTINHFRLLSKGVIVCFMGIDARQKQDVEGAISSWQRLTQWCPTVLAGPVLKEFSSFWWFFSYRVQDVLETEVGAVTFKQI